MFKHCLRFRCVAWKWVNGPSLEKKIVKLLIYETKISHHSFKIIFMQLSDVWAEGPCWFEMELLSNAVETSKEQNVNFSLCTSLGGLLAEM